MTTQLTPYDTGDRLEPQPWPLESDDHYGLVDLDNDESATVFTISGKRLDDNTANRTADGSPGYLLSVSTYSDDTAVEIDGDRVLVLDEDTLAGLNTLVELAEQGTAVDADAWRLVQGTIKKIQGARP
ncbi:hypothetical protein ICL81_07890 [Leucobacter sp. cx-328]|uniref:hypothetical protein n=1 Tax=unclassified Leucobacter TaxID=2621730 RepID=UPI00165E3443|nr:MULTISPECIES: hypothetical protein [unclassified Leucobacter]MBC9944428.1 hypothetical protein [Leucobacter sp. cx-328]